MEIICCTDKVTNKDMLRIVNEDRPKQILSTIATLTSLDG